MSDKDCPDKLEPEPQHIHTSVLKNVPIDMMWHIREHHSKPSHYTIRWRAREPVEGKHYGYGGDLKFADAQSADMYITDDTKHELMKKYLELKNKNADLKRDLDVLQYDYDGVVRFTEMHRDMDAKYEKLEKKYDDLNDVHRSLSKEYNDLMQDNCKDQWTDDMSEQADKDYDAVTKGVISFINLLRR